MLKKRYKIFLVIFILVMIVGAWLSSKIIYTLATPKVEEYTFCLSKCEELPLENVPLSFSFEKQNVLLHYTSEVEEHLEQVYFRYSYGDVDCLPVESFQYDDTMNGTLLVMSKTADESVLISSKVSLVSSQGYDTHAYDNHTYADATIPVEISYYGTTLMTTDASVLVNGVPYTGQAYLQSKAGKNEMVEIQEGVLTGLSIHDLRKGMTISVTNEETGQLLVGTYIVEDYPVFEDGFLEAISNLFLLSAMIGIGCVAVCAIRYGIRRFLATRE